MSAYSDQPGDLDSSPGTGNQNPFENTDNEPLFSLVSGEGDGFMLGVAAGDAAGGAWELGYSAVTEQITVICYQLIQHRHLDPTMITRRVRELDGSEDGGSVYRAESPHFRVWLDRAATGSPMPDDEPATDGIARAVPVGVAYRRESRHVVEGAIELSRIFHRDAGSIAAGAISASAVAASCFGQTGRDLVAGVAEAVMPAIDDIAGGAVGEGRLESLEQDFSTAMDAVGTTSGEEVLASLGDDPADPIHQALAGVALAAPADEVPHGPVEQAARIGGSILGAAVGAIIGSREGIRAWPWAFANDTWFAEIGRRLTRGPDEIRDLPIPYAVEQHLITGVRADFH